MPLTAGKSEAVVSQNIEEFHRGKTYQRTKAKFGKDKADGTKSGSRTARAAFRSRSLCDRSFLHREGD
jgi:hypothetical protein